MTSIRKYEGWYQQQSNWFRQQYYQGGKEPHSILQHSGWLNTDTTEHPAWREFLSVIDRHGSILDLGCGNGILLRALVDHSAYKLIPYGVDFLEESIEEARTLIIPEFREHFYTANVDDFDFRGRHYTFIITSPAYVHPTAIETFLKKCCGHLDPQAGRLILYEYSKVAVIPGYQSIADHNGRKVDGRLITSSAVRMLVFDNSIPKS